MSSVKRSILFDFDIDQSSISTAVEYFGRFSSIHLKMVNWIGFSHLRLCSNALLLCDVCDRIAKASRRDYLSVIITRRKNIVGAIQFELNLLDNSSLISSNFVIIEEYSLFLMHLSDFNRVARFVLCSMASNVLFLLFGHVCLLPRNQCA